MNPEPVEQPQVKAAESIGDAANAAAAIDGSGKPEFRLQNGVVLELKPVPPIAIREAALQKPPPQVPTVFIEDKGREEQNPNDPDYHKAMQQYAFDQLYRITDVLLLLGTGIVSIPDDVFPVESDEWVEQLAALAIDVPPFNNKYARYLSWLRLYAICSEYEVGYILGNVTAMSGVTEVEVQRAAASFRDRARR